MRPSSWHYEVRRGAAIAVLVLGLMLTASPLQVAGGWQLGEK